MLRAHLIVCTALVVSACDSQAAEKAAEEARAAAAKLATKEREIADLRSQLAAKDAAPATPTPPAAGPGQLDPEIVRIAAAGARKLKLELEADGAVRKLAVYHDDASALPAAVVARTSEVYPGGVVRHYETELYRDLGRVYEIEVTTKDKQSCELSAREDGTIVYKECELDPKSLPAEISAAIARDAAGRKLLEVERKDYADGKTEFVAEVGPDPKTAKPAKPAKKGEEAEDEAAGEELYFDATGKLLRREITLTAEVEIARP